MAIITREVDVEGLLRGCANGSEASWSRLVDHFAALVYSIPKRMGLTEDDCQDVFQNTFLALMKSLDRIESGRSLPKWLAVTASREALRHQRFKFRAGHQLPEDLSLDELLAAEDKSAEQLASEACDSESVWQAIEKLGGRCRDLLTLLFKEEEKSYQDISAQVGIPVGAIGPTRARCLDKLRKSLENEGLFD